jgi:kinesin family protein 4/21/27
VQSSRSHSILTIRIESYDRTGASSLLSSKLELVDLAGSERIGLTGTEGKQAKESIDINKSLFTLRQVISILA